MALRCMTLRDFVIVDQLEIDFEPGFTALTGETGAGKSILVDALQLVLGARADAGVVREGAARTDLSAQFDTPSTLQGWLADGGFDAGPELLLRRTIDNSGKSRAWVNGAPATAAQLRELGTVLLDIHGQHAWQRLTNSSAVRDLLDAFARADSTGVQSAWTAWRSAVQALDAARALQASAGAERERLQWQISELDKLAPKPGEWTALNEEHTRLGHAQALMDAARSASDRLDDDAGSARTALAQALDALQALEHLEPRFRDITALLTDSLAQTEEAARALHAYLRRDALDASQLQTLDERVGQWLGLARRFKRPPEELPATLADWKLQLAALDAGSDLDALTAQEQQRHQAYTKAAQKLSRERAAAAPKLSNAVTAMMQDLGMAGGQFCVQISPLMQAASSGIDEVEFLVAGHAGATPRPIAKVASGGELSRIALAIAIATSALESADTLIFDEVDSGIGGAVAQTVGQLMRRLGQTRQVLAVTHLPQVAACANHHFVVSKSRSAQGALSRVAAVHGSHRITEVARMLGGEKATQASLAHAREMLCATPTQGAIE